MVSDPSKTLQYRSASRSSAVCTVALPKLQGVLKMMLWINTGIAAMLNGMHSSIDEK